MWQGRQARCLGGNEFGLFAEGLNPSAGVVLPQKLISGFPVPAATCIIRESLVGVSLARLTSSTDSKKDVLPVKSKTLCSLGKCSRIR